MTHMATDDQTVAAGEVTVLTTAVLQQAAVERADQLVPATIGNPPHLDDPMLGSKTGLAKCTLTVTTAARGRAGLTALHVSWHQLCKRFLDIS